MRTRIGCDRCKHDVPTYIFRHSDDVGPLWFCDGCYDALIGEHPPASAGEEE